MSQLSFDLYFERAGGFALKAAAELPPGCITGIYGPSGSGKTTLLNIIAGLLPAQGRLRLGDELWQENDTARPPHRRGVGYVFQDSRLFPHLDVAGNLVYAWRRRRTARGPTPEQAAGWCGLQSLTGQRPHQLSRGQQQRAALARALVSAPGLLMLDEPLGNVDLKSRRQLLDRLRQFCKTSGTTVLYVSHDMAELSQVADWLVVLSEGAVTASGPLLELTSRLDLALAHEAHSASILLATIAGHDRRYGLTELDLSGQPVFVTELEGDEGTQVRLRLPARDVSLCLTRPEQTSILNVLEVRVDSMEASDHSQMLVRLQLAEQYLLARVTRKSLENLALRAGQVVFAQVKSVALLNDTQEPPRE